MEQANPSQTPTIDAVPPFSHPLNIERLELDSLFDCYSAKPWGNWPIKPRLSAPMGAYVAAAKALDCIESVGPFSSLRDYIVARSRVKGKELLRMYIERLPDVDEELGACVLRAAEMSGLKSKSVDEFLHARADDHLVKAVLEKIAGAFP